MQHFRASARIAACTLALAACARARQQPNGAGSILQAAGDSVQVRLLDAETARPLANANAELWSDNGVRCIKAPCPTDGKQWTGTSDADGRVSIPRNALNTTANIKTGTHSGDLVGDATSDGKGLWSVELFADDCPDLCPHPLKLLDARSHEPIANHAVLIQIRNATAHDVTSVTTNALGYVFVPVLFMAKGAESSWLVVDGYRDVKIDFAAARRKTMLQRR